MLLPESMAAYPTLKKPECAQAGVGAAALRMA